MSASQIHRKGKTRRQQPWGWDQVPMLSNLQAFSPAEIKFMLVPRCRSSLCKQSRKRAACRTSHKELRSVEQQAPNSPTCFATQNPAVESYASSQNFPPPGICRCLHLGVASLPCTNVHHPAFEVSLASKAVRTTTGNVTVSTKPI